MVDPPFGPNPGTPPSTEPEKQLWYDSHRSKQEGQEYFGALWRGIGATIPEGKNITKTIETELGQEGCLQSWENLDYAERQFLEITGSIVRRLPKLVKAYPKNLVYLRRWVSDWILSLAMEVARQYLSDPSNIGATLVPKGGKSNVAPGKAQSSTSIKAPPVAERGLVIFKLIIMSEDKTNEVATEEIHAHNTLPVGSNKTQDTNYKLGNTLREFEHMINNTPLFFQEKDNINLRHGEFGYMVGRKFKPTKRQIDFENAVSYLFKRFKTNGTIEFTFNMEDKAEKAGREGRRRAAERAKSQDTVKPITAPGAKFGAVAGLEVPFEIAATGSRKPASSNQDSLDQLDGPKTPENGPQNDTGHLASPSKGFHKTTSKVTPSEPHNSLPGAIEGGTSTTATGSHTSAFDNTPPKKGTSLNIFRNLLKSNRYNSGTPDTRPKRPFSIIGPPSSKDRKTKKADPKPKRPSSIAGSPRSKITKGKQPDSIVGTSIGKSPSNTSGLSRLSTPGSSKGGKRISSLFHKGAVKPVPDSPVDEGSSSKEQTAAERLVRQDQRFRELSTPLYEEIFVKGKSEEDIIQDDIMSYYCADTTAGETEFLGLDPSEKLLDEDEQPDVATSNGEFMASQLQKMTASPALTQMQDPDLLDSSYPRWREAAIMFKFDPRQKKNTELIRMDGLKSRLYPYQAFGIWWQVKKSREVGGGFVGDEMGLGKTLSFLAYVVIERQLAWLWQQVNLARTRLTKDESPQHHMTPQPEPCPSEHTRQYWIACPCSSGNITSTMKPKPGVRVAFVPPSLIGTWMAEWEKHIDTTEKRLELKLAVAHPPAFPLGGNAASQLLNAQAPAAITRMRASRVFIDQKKQCSVDEPSQGQERILLLTTAQAFKSYIDSNFSYETHIEFFKEKKTTQKKARNPGIVFGIAMIDEVHESRPPKGKGVLTELPITNSPFLWGYSGTPLTSSPRGLEQILVALENRSPKTLLPYNRTISAWQADPNLRIFTNQRFEQLCTEFETLIKLGAGVGVGNLMEDFKPRFQPFLRMFMIRRTAESQWFGAPLIRLKVHYHHDIALRANESFAEDLAEFKRLYHDPAAAKLLDERAKRQKENVLAKKTVYEVGDGKKLPFAVEYTLAVKLRLFATLPYLVKFALAPKGSPDHLEFDKDETRIRAAPSQLMKSLYANHIKGIVESSPKMMWLYNFLKEWFQKGDEACDGDRVRDRKLIIMSSNDVVIVVVKLLINKYFPKFDNAHLAMVLSTTPPRESGPHIRSFSEVGDITHSAATQPMTARDRAKTTHLPQGSPRIQILLGNSSKIGRGLNFTRASTVVLLEPDIMFQRESQIYSRVHRIGQRASEGSESFRLWCETKAAYGRSHKDREQTVLTPGEEWEWEYRIVDRVRSARKLTFGRKLEEVVEEEGELAALEEALEEEDSQDFEAANARANARLQKMDPGRNAAALAELEFGDLVLEQSPLPRSPPPKVMRYSNDTIQKKLWERADMVFQGLPEADFRGEADETGDIDGKGKGSAH